VVGVVKLGPVVAQDEDGEDQDEAEDEEVEEVGDEVEHERLIDLSKGGQTFLEAGPACDVANHLLKILVTQ